MTVSAWNSRTDRYELIPLDVALKDNKYHLFHPMAENQLDTESALEDAFELRDPYLLAEALIVKMESSHMNARHMKIFLIRFLHLMAARS